MRRKNPSRICSRHGLALSAFSGGMEESREKREERREKREESKWPPARFTAYGRCPVTTSKNLKTRDGHPTIFTAYWLCPFTTSKSAQKYFSSLLPKVRKAEGASQRLANSIHFIFTVSRGHVVEGKIAQKNM